jgi:hypothetical protein
VDTSTQLEELKKEERSRLFAEWLDLKQCQRAYISLATLSTGALLGVAASLSRWNQIKDFPRSAFLLPLVVIIPSWWICFEKTRALSRIIGFQLLSEDPDWRYVRWQSALEVLRNREVIGNTERFPHQEGSRAPGVVWKTLKGKVPNPYWNLIYVTFFGLVIVTFCAWVYAPGNYSAKELFAVTLALLISSVSAVVIGLILADVQHGRLSYANQRELWRMVLARISVDDMGRIRRETTGEELSAKYPRPGNPPANRTATEAPPAQRRQG